MAQVVYQNLLSRNMLNVEVDSAGLHGLHIGNNADQRALAVLKENNLLTNHKSRLINKQDLLENDYILVAENYMIEYITKFGLKNGIEQIDLPKIYLYAHFNKNNSSQKLSDPYLGQLTNFRICFSDLTIYANDFCNYLKQKNVLT
jgi:protein-tyrosine phosphatase